MYYPDPAAISPNNPVPVLFFIYGGGFVFGERQEKSPFNLGYGNLGTFFAKRGYVQPYVLFIATHLTSSLERRILTVIPDYRLYPSVTFPGPVEDVRDAIAWFLANTSTVTSAAPSTLSHSTPFSNIFVLSHSAGTNHLATLYLSPSLLPLDSPVRAATRGLIPQGSAYYFDLARQDLLPPGILDGYYSSPEVAAANMPLALLKDASEDLLKSLPEILVMKSEREPPVIFAGSDVFVKELEERLGKKVRYDVIKAHNHISPHWALTSGEGEEWGEEVVTWVKERA